MADRTDRERLMSRAFAAMQHAHGLTGSPRTIAVLECQMYAAAALRQWASAEEAAGWPCVWDNEPKD
ncbi:MAG: hypothetical protein IVW56_09695 [Candidatus Binataceae bacterium]|nr:hypothetical protein [Candidatus Binataceae bacterium]